MPKTCRVKILTRRPRKRRGFCGNKGKKDTDVNSDVNIDNSVDNDCGDPNNILPYLVYLQTRQLHQTKKSYP